MWDSVAGGCSMVCFHFFFSFFFWGVSGVAGASDGLNLVGYPSFFFVFSDLIAAGGMWVWLLMDQPHVRRISFIFFFISTWPPHAVAFVSFFFISIFPLFFFLLPLLGGRGRWTAYEIAVRKNRKKKRKRIQQQQQQQPKKKQKKQNREREKKKRKRK